jgi:predicted nucleic acid-binding protein
MVLVDTCMCVPFFNRPQSPEKKIVDQLLDDDRVALVGPILAEILQGFRRDEQADWVASELRGVRYIDIDWDDWRAAARLGRSLVARGHTLPLTDLAIAAVAMNHDASVYSSDPHFDLLPSLSRFSV